MPIIENRGLFLTIFSAALMFGCTSKAPTVSFQSDVKPIIDAKCLDCHRQGTEGYEASGLLLDSYAGLMRGTKFGPVVIPGDSLTSALLILVEGRADPSIAMPHNQGKLAQEELDTLKAWVEQGARNN